MSSAPSVPGAVLEAFGWTDCTIGELTGGLINATYLVASNGEAIAVLQRLHPVFEAEVCLDLDAVTTFLANAGLATPRLIRTMGGEASFTFEGRPWRAITYVRGVTVSRVASLDQARSAGQLVGRVHAALSSFDYDYRHVRAGVHDTAAHLNRLAKVRDEREDDEAGPLADRILEAAGSLPPLAGVPLRHCHGDLKISNVLFDEGATRALCLLDLDTFGRQSIAYELGDAFRSWCNPAGEDTAEPSIELDVLAAALEGYAVGSSGLLEPNEIASIVPGIETVCLELAARFCVDVFEDSYFGWDATRFPSRRAHNLVRARGQLALASSVARQRDAATRITLTAFN